MVLKLRGNEVKEASKQRNLHFVCRASVKTLRYRFSVTSVSPTAGSLMGGTNVTVEGEGFTDAVQVKFGDVGCNVVASTETRLTCVTKPATTSHVVSNDGKHLSTSSACCLKLP